MANGPRLTKFALAIFLPNLLLRMRRNCYSCPSCINVVQNEVLRARFRT